jgi:hypothetical protein
MRTMEKQTDKELEEIPKDIDKICDYLEQEFNLAPTQHAVLVDELIKFKEKARQGMVKIEDVEKMIDKLGKKGWDGYLGVIHQDELKQSLKKLGEKQTDKITEEELEKAYSLSFEDTKKGLDFAFNLGIIKGRKEARKGMVKIEDVRDIIKEIRKIKGQTIELSFLEDSLNLLEKQSLQKLGEKQHKLEDYLDRLEHLEELAADIEVTAYHLRLDLKKELEDKRI